MPKQRKTLEEILATNERRREKKKAYAKANRAYFNAKQKEYRERYPEYVEAYQKAYRAAYFPEYVRNNRAKYNAIAAARRAQQRNAYPDWADRKAIREIYELAQEFREAGFDVHVDHIVPIVNKQVCGLHVPANLRVCLARVNMRKGNLFPYF